MRNGSIFVTETDRDRDRRLSLIRYRCVPIANEGKPSVSVSVSVTKIEPLLVDINTSWRNSDLELLPLDAMSCN